MVTRGEAAQKSLAETPSGTRTKAGRNRRFTQIYADYGRSQTRHGDDDASDLFFSLLYFICVNLRNLRFNTFPLP